MALKTRCQGRYSQAFYLRLLQFLEYVYHACVSGSLTLQNINRDIHVSHLRRMARLFLITKWTECVAYADAGWNYELSLRSFVEAL